MIAELGHFALLAALALALIQGIFPLLGGYYRRTAWIALARPAAYSQLFFLVVAFAGLTHEQKIDRMCELNVVEQVANVCHTTILQDAWARGQDVSVHGFIFSVRDGILRDLGVHYSAANQLPPIYRMDETAS